MLKKKHEHVLCEKKISFGIMHFGDLFMYRMIYFYLKIVIAVIVIPDCSLVKQSGHGIKLLYPVSFHWL